MQLEKVILSDFQLENGKVQARISLTFQISGCQLGTAPVVLVNHGLTGNSDVCSEKGWWKTLIGKDRTINLDSFTVLAFDIPGNGFDGDPENLIPNYHDFTARDVARIFWEGLTRLKIESLFAVIGASLGGGIAWEMAALRPDAITHLVPVAADWKATDWLIANVLVQDRILNNSDNPIADARLHAMLLYRTPQSLKLKFNRGKLDGSDIYQTENWLVSHGFRLQIRFRLASYKLMNHLLKTIDISKKHPDFETVAQTIQSQIHLVSIDSDLFFTPDETRETYEILRKSRTNVFYHEIKSVHGHDAFLIETDQLSNCIRPIFNTQKILTLCPQPE